MKKEIFNTKKQLIPGSAVILRTKITNENIKEMEESNRILVETADGRLFAIKTTIKIKEL